MMSLVRSAICALYPRTGDLPGAEDCGIDDFLQRFRRDTTRLMWFGIVIGAIVFHATPIVTLLVPLPAFLLPRRLRDRHASKIAGTRFYLVRQLIFLLKLAGGLCWGAHPDVRKRFALAPLPEDPDAWRTG